MYARFMTFCDVIDWSPPPTKTMMMVRSARVKAGEKMYRTQLAVFSP